MGQPPRFKRRWRATAPEREQWHEAYGVLTGHSGPGRWLFDRGRRWGVGERIVKSALAAGLAWFLATHLLDNPIPILAPITAIYAIQVTVAQSVTGIAQRLLGLIAGLFVAFGVVVIGGASALTIGLGVLVSLLIGVRLRLDTVALTQLMTTAVVGIAGGGSHEGWHYLVELLLDTSVGAAVGVTLNLLIVPPTHVDAVFVSLARLLSAAADAVETLGAVPGDLEARADISLRLSLLRAAHDNAVTAAREHSDLLASGEWVIAGEILGAAAQLLGELELAAM